jgi:polyphosphate kinase
MAESVRVTKRPPTKKGQPASRPTEVTTVDLDSPKLYINRELSLLAYHRRVIAQAADSRHPLLERVRFVSMASNQLDEFFMVRVSDLQEQVDAAFGEELPPDRMTPAQQLAAIREQASALFRELNRILCKELLPELAQQGVHLVELASLSANQRAGLHTYFDQEVFPVLTPLAVDPGHPFPHISNLSVNLAVELAGTGADTRFARVKIPDVIPRLVHIERVLGQHVSGKKSQYTFIWLDELVAQNLPALFPGVPVRAWYPFRVIRDADIEIHEEEGADLRMSVEKGLNQRRFGEPVQLTVEHDMPQHMRSLLAAQLGIDSTAIYDVHRPLGLVSLDQLTSIDRPDLKYVPLVPRIQPSIAAGEPIITIVDRHDVLLHHPYDSFAPVVDLLSTSARDDSVLAIKQTLYRVGTDSPIVRALLDAVNRGKQVAVLVELKARFDEASNIEWAQELERAGVHVVYGFVGLKTHAKVALVIRKDSFGIHRYVHLGTGNYNASTARAYSDLSFFTSDADFGTDATDLFNFLTGYSEQKSYRRFLVAPINLRQELLYRINRETMLHRQNGGGRLLFKMNSLVDKEFIVALYQASQAGVQVDLIVRGICCLRPGVPGVSENIRVISLVGRFLEHSRIFYFENGGEPELYAGSADLMPRNLDHRVEVLFPVQDAGLRERIVRNILQLQWHDNVNAWRQNADGSYERILPEGDATKLDTQAWSITHGFAD